jgi:sulfatase maturation enzyme AslB (radical SAM superfamily)
VTSITELPVSAPAGRIGSLLIKPASALCNLDCSYCFYLDRALDPYGGKTQRHMSLATLERLVQSWLAYSYPNSTFAFQGGEPTLCGPEFYAQLCELQKRYGRNGQNVSNSMQTNGVLLNERWCEIFREYNFLLGISLDGPAAIHDLYRRNKEGRGTWKQAIRSIELPQKRLVDFNALCVVSTANVERPKELYKFYKSLGDRVSAIHSSGGVRWRRTGARVYTVARTVWTLPLRDVRPVVARHAAGAHSLLRQFGRGYCWAETGCLHYARSLRQLRGG